MKRNQFIAAALEELQQEIATGDQTAIAVATPTDTPADSTGAPQVTETNIDQSVDAVAALMQKNTELATENVELQSETFDNDVDAIQSVSDSVHRDLDEAVQAGVALEQLAHIAQLTVKSGQANAASVAGLAFALEQISINVGMKSSTAALEDNTLRLEGPKAQAEAVGKAAEEKAKSIFERLIEGIKRIVGWILNVMRQMFSSFSLLTNRIKKASAELNQIEESNTIDSLPFIASLRLVEGGGDINKQFEEYARLATKTLYGFFNTNFIDHMTSAFESLGKEESDADKQAGNKQLAEILRTAMSVIYTENATFADMAGKAPEAVQSKDLTIGKTVPCVGGVQLYLAATLDGGEFYCRGGLVKTSPKFDAPESIPVANIKQADQMFGLITKWIQDHSVLERNLQYLGALKFTHMLASSSESKSKAIGQYLSVLASLATGTIPQFLRMNIRNSINFVTYVEKSIAVSKAKTAEKK